MNTVGDRLRDIAAKEMENDSARFDLFTRSAFNRYYYSVFLTVRTALGTIKAEWAEPHHKDVPVLLEKSVLKRIKEEIAKYRKKGQITDAEASRVYSMAATAAVDLAQLMRRAYEIRRVADYEPEAKVENNLGTAKLDNCTIATASGWQRRADIQTKIILKAYGRLGVIRS